MNILPEPLSFDWDKGNIVKNVKKHNVTIQESEEVFSNESFIIYEDTKHSTDKEKRFQGLGVTKLNRKMFVACTIRSDKIRIISVRDMNNKEEVQYEKLKKNT